MLARLLLLLTTIFPLTGFGAVILQYHHVSVHTPPSTTITPAQFERHMQFLKDNGFTVVPLNQIVDAIKNNQPTTEKWVAITFDDAFTDILENGTPVLERYDFPYTIFVNPGVVANNGYLKWPQLQALSKKGVLIANHGYHHDSIARVPENFTKQEWTEIQSGLLLQAENIIKEKTGQSWQYFAYPYGEFNPEIQQWLKNKGFVGFSQQSGAAGVQSDLTVLPRFPVSQPYDQLTSLRDKLNSLPLNISLDADNAQTIFKHGQLKRAVFNVDVNDFKKRQLNCYISGLGRQKINWLNDQQFAITFSKDLPVGRVRCNCTAPSLSESGRFYWYSKPWFILKADGEWYPL